MPVFSSPGEILMLPPGELRILAPLLPQREHLVLDGADGKISNIETGMGFLLYTPVEGRVEDGRVNFAGEHYQFVTAAPIIRAETLCARFGSKLKPSELALDLREDQGSFGAFRLSAASSHTR
jgi:hypothetical protein